MEAKQKAASASVSTLINGCGDCKEDTPAVSWCMQCGNLLCENCNTTRHWKVQSHYLIRIEEFLEILASDLASNSCQSHGKQLMMYCSTCSSQVCQDCIIKDHSKHKLTVQKTRTLEQMKRKQSQQNNVSFEAKPHCRVGKLLPNRSSENATVKSQPNQKSIQYICTHVHPTESLYLYCVTCDGLICQECTVGDHYKHSYATIDRVSAKVIKSESKPLTQFSSLRWLFGKLTLSNSKDHRPTYSASSNSSTGIKPEVRTSNHHLGDNDPSRVPLVIEKRPPYVGNDSDVSKTDWLAKHKTNKKQYTHHSSTVPSSFLKEKE